MAVASAMASSALFRGTLQSRRAPPSSPLYSRVGGSDGLRRSVGLLPASSPAFLRMSSALRCRKISASLNVNPEKFKGPSSANGDVHFSRNFFQVLQSVAARVGRMRNAVRNSVQQPQTEEEMQLLTALKGRMVCAAGPILFAAVSQSVNTPLTVVASGMAKWLELYSGVLMVRVLLSWFPNIPWERQPLQAMRDMCDPYLNLFRNIIPPLFNALDLSPMLAFLVLGVLTSILNTTVQST